MTSKEIIEELEHDCRRVSNVNRILRTARGSGVRRPRGLSVRVLDKTNTMIYKALGEVNDKFMAALGKREEIKGLFTFFASNYPQYEIVINNTSPCRKESRSETRSITSRSSSAAPGTRASSSSASSTKCLFKPHPSSDGILTISTICSSRTIKVKWFRTPRS